MRQARHSTALDVLVGWFVGFALACSSSGEAEQIQAAKSAAASAKPVAEDESASARPRLAIHRDLTAEAARAELGIGGLFIDFGTPDQHKYTRGGWHTGWGALGADKGGASFGKVEDRSAEVCVLLREQPGEIALRVRSAVAGQRVALKLGRKELGSSDVGQEWTVVRVPGRSLPQSGRVSIDLAFRRPANGTAVAEVDWLWFASSPGASPAEATPRVAPLELSGRKERALLAPAPRSYSFYLQPPPDATLVFAYGSEQAIGFSIAAETVDGEMHQLFRATAQSGRWTPATVDLGPFAGKVIRLELATTGSAKRTGWGEPAIGVPRPAQPAPTADEALKRPKNVVFIVMDTCRADMYPTVNPDSKVSLPHFDAFAKKSASFANAYDNESWTKPSTTTLLSGLYPRTHRVFYVKSVVPEEVWFLSEHLDKHGFQTAAISTNTVVKDNYGFDQGWDSFVCVARTDRAEGEYVYADAIEWVEKNAKAGPFLLYLQTVECHTPYAVDRKYSELYHPKPYYGKIGSTFESRELAAIAKEKMRVTEADFAWIRALYYGEATYHDEHMGRLLTALEKLGLLEETLVVITNDHGEELYDHEGMGHTWTSYEELLRAPLVIYYPPLFPPGKRFLEVVEHVDLAPTIVDALGLPPMPDVDGQSLLPLVTGKGERLRPYYAVADLRPEVRVIRVGRWKLFVDYRTGWKALYDLQADPGEKHDRRRDRLLAGRFAEIYLGEALAAPKKAERLLTTSQRRELRQANVALDAETRAELKATGYIDGTDEPKQRKRKP